ncbi:hypothetical protein E4U40_002540 [Claviceps sp. LM458 group G5]|nr:hypothetical protein E4U40_002540 [Claviceps sp. LM458 group G5]
MARHEKVYETYTIGFKIGSAMGFWQPEPRHQPPPASDWITSDWIINRHRQPLHA